MLEKQNSVLSLTEGDLYFLVISLQNLSFLLSRISKININKRSACQLTLLNKAVEMEVRTCSSQSESLKS